MPDSTMHLSGVLINSTTSERDVGKDSAILSREKPSGKAETFSHALADANQRRNPAASEGDASRREQMTRSESGQSAQSDSTPPNKIRVPSKTQSSRSQSDHSAGQSQNDVAANTPASAPLDSQRLDRYRNRSGVSREANEMAPEYVESSVSHTFSVGQPGVVESPSGVADDTQIALQAALPMGAEAAASTNITQSGSTSGQAVTGELLTAETISEKTAIGGSVLPTHAGSIGQQSTHSPASVAPEAIEILPAASLSASGLRGSLTAEGSTDESSLAVTGHATQQGRIVSTVSTGSTDTLTGKQADSNVTTLPASLAARLVTGSDTATRAGTTGTTDQRQGQILNPQVLSAADAREELPRAGIVTTAQNNQEALLVTHALVGKLANSEGKTDAASTKVKSAVPIGGPIGLRQVVGDAVSTSTDSRSIEGSLMASTVKTAEGHTENAVRFSQLGGVRANVTAGGAVILPDNMLADVTGGIVTAPVSSRTDAASTQIASAPLNVALLTPAASDSMAGNIRWMVNEGVQNASVTVSPAGMGPIAVKIGIDNEQMNVSIVATQGSTREALDALLPRLREQLLSQGHDSVRVDVSDGKSDNTRSNGHQQQSNDRHAFTAAQTLQDDGDTNEQRQEQYAGASTQDTQLQHGERRLSDAELDRVARLQGLLPDTARSLSALQRGYDLYV